LLAQSRREPSDVRARWRLLDLWCDVGAVSVRFANGKHAFVPFIRSARELAREALQPPPERSTRTDPPPDPPEVVKARLQRFVEKLRENDESTNVG
jgi:hypothetical protein